MATAAATKDSRWETVLKRQLVSVAEVLCPLRNRLPPRLYSHGLINGDEEERFTKSTKSETDLALEILGVLRKQGPGSFDEFCDVLLEPGDKTLDELESRFRPDRLIGIEKGGSDDSTSEQKLNRKSVQILMKESLLKDFKEREFGEQLKLALFHGLGIPKESIISYPACHQFNYSERKWIHVVHVANKALITVVVSGVEKAEVERHANTILNLLSLEAGVKDSEIEIVQILSCNSCLLVIRLPGLAMVQLIITFFSPQTRPVFCQRFANILPGAFKVTFGFASLPDCSAELPSLHPILKSGDNPSHFTKDCSVKLPSLHSVPKSGDGPSHLTRQPQKADENVTRKELRDLAILIQSCWKEFALYLDPDHFTLLGEIATIECQHTTRFLQAQAMLERWHSYLGNNVPRRLLIEALIRQGHRIWANEVFGEEVVKQMMPQY